MSQSQRQRGYSGASMPSHAGEPCPDPSAHEKHNKLSEQASTAALYVTQQHPPARSSEDRRESPLDADGKISSKSAAASLKYASARDLPSFPSSGLASNANDAGKAAMLAKDYQAPPLWQPELSSAGSRAALLAHKKGPGLDLWQPTASAEGHSAATQAMQKKGLIPDAIFTGSSKEEKSKALQAATIVSAQSRQRANSTPKAPAHPAYPDSKNSAANALNAATASHRAASVRDPKMAPDGWDSPANQAARITNVGQNLNREMFTSHPPVSIEVTEASQKASRHAEAVGLAQQMFAQQQKAAAAGAGAKKAVANQAPSSAGADLKTEAMKYIHLQDAAHKLAAERLAKIDKSGENARYREYYGYPSGPGAGKQASPTKSGPTNRLSMHGRDRRQRRRGSDSSSDDDDDAAAARRIRTQMSTLNSGVAVVDEKKRTDDRARLMAAAEKRVQARMQDMDAKVFSETGKVTPSMQEAWEAKARARLQESKEQEAAHPGQTHIGGGKFMAMSEIEAIAAARLKPTMEAIDATAAKRRARDEELRVEREEGIRAKNDEKAKGRMEKDEVKRHKAEEKLAAKNEKISQRKSRELARDEAAAAIAQDAEETPKVEKRRSGKLGRLLHRNKNTAATPAAVEASSTTAVPVAAGIATAVAGAVVASPSTPQEGPELPEVVVNDGTTSVVSALGADETAEAKEIQDGTDILTPTVSRFSAAGRPDLERHITNIETSSESSSDDWERDDEESGVASPTGLVGKTAGATKDDPMAIAERVVSAPVVATSSGEPEKVAQLHEDRDPNIEGLSAPAVFGPVVATVVDAAPSTAAAATPASATATATEAKPPTSTDDAPGGGKSGFRGFFSKLRSKQSQPHSQPTPSQPTTSTAPSPAGGAAAAAPLTPPPSALASVPRDASPSSFRRRSHAAERDLDDVSSSGLEESDLEDDHRGRSRRGKKVTGKGKGKAPVLARLPTAGTDGEDEQFEEARDHFEESALAPPKVGAGMGVEGSPVRSTKFQEEL